jgi:hypothetical protein
MVELGVRCRSAASWLTSATPRLRMSWAEPTCFSTVVSEQAHTSAFAWCLTFDFRVKIVVLCTRDLGQHMTLVYTAAEAKPTKTTHLDLSFLTNQPDVKTKREWVHLDEANRKVQ